MQITHYLPLIRSMVAQGGPEEHEYETLTNFISEFNAARSCGRLTDWDKNAVIAEFGDAFSLATIQGFIYHKPHGYAGDFEIIDRIYNQWVSPKEHLKAWDVYFHQLSASKAVRNRKAYFHRYLDSLVQTHPNRMIRLLNIGSGPGRCIAEWLDCNPSASIHIDCVDNDARAIGFATALNVRHLDRLTLRHENALKLQGDQTYDVIWSAGLFDYFQDNTFVRIIKRLLPMLAEGGQMVIGNFSDANPTLPHMEFSQWHLHHRSGEQLEQLMRQAGLGQVCIAHEPEQVNLFVHASR